MSREWQARPGSGAEGRVDLLTVVLHELGHVLGLAHDDQPGCLLSPTLAPGLRRRISPADVDALFASLGHVIRVVLRLVDVDTIKRG